MEAGEREKASIVFLLTSFIFSYNSESRTEHAGIFPRRMVTPLLRYYKYSNKKSQLYFIHEINLFIYLYTEQKQ